jgi:hypothetical protein
MAAKDSADKLVAAVGGRTESEAISVPVVGEGSISGPGVGFAVDEGVLRMLFGVNGTASSVCAVFVTSGSFRYV